MDKITNIKKCILCNSSKIKLEQILNVEDIIDLYYINFNIDISNEFLGYSYVEFFRCTNCKLKFFNTKFVGSGEFYEKLQKNIFGYYDPNRDEFNFAKKFVDDTDEVLEIGSGSGFFAEKVNKNHYTGLEYNDKAIIEAKKKGINLVKNSIEDYNIKVNNKYDIVCSFHVLEHVPNPREFIKASVNLLKENGKLIYSVPNNKSALTNNINHVLNLPPHHLTRWNFDSLNQIALIFNLKLIDYKIHSNNKSKKNYFRVLFLNKVYRLFFPKCKILINPQKTNRIKRFSNYIFNKLYFHFLFNSNKVIGENITMVFQKIK